jgi:hypothetical protein
MAENKICHFGNKCNKGNKCPFVHTDRGNTSASSAKPTKKCHFGDKCKNIPTCRFDHSSPTVDSLTTTIEKLKVVIELRFALFLSIIFIL